jgi:hypothetical protein
MSPIESIREDAEAHGFSFVASLAQKRRSLVEQILDSSEAKCEYCDHNRYHISVYLCDELLHLIVEWSPCQRVEVISVWEDHTEYPYI